MKLVLLALSFTSLTFYSMVSYSQGSSNNADSNLCSTAIDNLEKEVFPNCTVKGGNRTQEEISAEIEEVNKATGKAKELIENEISKWKKAEEYCGREKENEVVTVLIFEAGCDEKDLEPVKKRMLELTEKAIENQEKWNNSLSTVTTVKGDVADLTVKAREGEHERLTDYKAALDRAKSEGKTTFEAEQIAEKAYQRAQNRRRRSRNSFGAQYNSDTDHGGNRQQYQNFRKQTNWPNESPGNSYTNNNPSDSKYARTGTNSPGYYKDAPNGYYSNDKYIPENSSIREKLLDISSDNQLIQNRDSYTQNSNPSYATPNFDSNLNYQVAIPKTEKIENRKAHSESKKSAHRADNQKITFSRNSQKTAQQSFAQNQANHSTQNSFNETQNSLSTLEESKKSDDIDSTNSPQELNNSKTISKREIDESDSETEDKPSNSLVETAEQTPTQPKSVVPSTPHQNVSNYQHQIQTYNDSHVENEEYSQTEKTIEKTAAKEQLEELNELPSIDVSIEDTGGGSRLKKKDKSSLLRSLLGIFKNDKKNEDVVENLESATHEELVAETSDFKMVDSPNIESISEKESPTETEETESESQKEEPGFFSKVASWVSDTLNSSKWFGTDKESDEAPEEERSIAYAKRDPVFEESEDSSDVVVIDGSHDLQSKSLLELASQASANGDDVTPGLNDVYEESPTLSPDFDIYGLTY